MKSLKLEKLTVGRIISESDYPVEEKKKLFEFVLQEKSEQHIKNLGLVLLSEKLSYRKSIQSRLK